MSDRKILPLEERCCVKVYPKDRWGSFNPYQCYKKGIVKRDGKLYCKIHDPEYVKTKDEERNKKWQEKWDKEHKEEEVRNKRRKLEEAYCKDLTNEELKAKVNKER